MLVDIHLLPAPIASVRHLVDVEDDHRAKFDQLRVLAQNTLHVLAAILLSDCHRLGLLGQLPTQPRAKRLAVGDFVTYINEAAGVLATRLEVSYVPELVQLYGERTKRSRQRRERLQRIVRNRNRDAHTASLAQTGTWLNELVIDVDAIIQELDCLRAHMMVSVRNVELAPDLRSSQLNGLRCHGFSQRYVSVKLPIARPVSRCEVVLIKVDRNDWLSLRPWLLYVWDGNESSTGGTEELALLNAVNERRLDFIGLVSGTEYQFDNDWTLYTMYELEAPHTYQVSDAERVVGDEKRTCSFNRTIEGPGSGEPSSFLDRLTTIRENVVARQPPGSRGEHHLISVRTPTREVAVASMDPSGRIHIFSRMLERAAQEGLIDKARLQRALDDLGQEGADEARSGGALVDIGHISERFDWLDSLALGFSDWR